MKTQTIDNTNLNINILIGGYYANTYLFGDQQSLNFDMF
jgi:hypothetical protein